MWTVIALREFLKEIGVRSSGLKVQLFIDGANSAVGLGITLSHNHSYNHRGNYQIGKNDQNLR
jgi:hypothetical protein